MTHEIAVQPPIVPLCGADEKQFRESLWKYLQTEIHPDIRKQSYLGSRLRYITFTTYGANSVKKRFQRGKPINLSESDKEKIRQKIKRLIAIEKEHIEGVTRRKYYSDMLLVVLRRDKVRLAFQDNKPVIQINFENDMVVFIYQNGCIEHELRRAIKTPSEADKYIADWGAKLSEITPQIMKIKSEVPPEFYERGKS